MNHPTPEPLNVFSTFAGIGGLELGLERAGMQVVAQVEIDDYCRQVLAMHWPDVPRHDDVRTAADWWLSTGRPRVDVVCGGFPCQPFSNAGKMLGTSDERWMWPAMWDVIRQLQPRYVVVENVASLVRDRDAFGTVLGDLAGGGFDAEWAVLPASDFGAPHRRERVIVLAYPARASMGSHGIAWTRAESGEHRYQLEDYLAWQHISGGQQRVSGLLVNPEWTDWLMGFPPRWTDCESSGTPSSLPSPSTSAG